MKKKEKRGKLEKKMKKKDEKNKNKSIINYYYNPQFIIYE
jgi:hypothetical protein